MAIDFIHMVREVLFFLKTFYFKKNLVAWLRCGLDVEFGCGVALWVGVVVGRRVRAWAGCGLGVGFWAV